MITPSTQALMDRVRAKREAAGLNVEWIREDSTVDNWSFANEERRDKFIAACRKRGLSAKIAGT